ncbi:hypothetical protein GV828_00420 [Flavobacterium sp. NST-5]|uniref:Permuted papain-like amidase YaeF/Yiix C92 family enzyme n=1 Tax=Flavobacterium ichthyis TaxID=2698827 RepID=A0ABW9ZA30_9FLAO|nr:YiiX/YebB-like N1pC/P60 family cysteine hydrolase [Flavobacterium ichthyis]NBL63658.1 hypothetical protein [Flavobacterium ichthyis]
MKKLFLITAMLFILGFATFKIFFYFDKKSEAELVVKHQNTTRLSAEELSKIHEGDLILRRGFGFFSDYISTELNDGEIDVTHAGIIVKQHDSLFVIHSLSSDVTDIDGMQIQPLREFLSYSHPQKIIVSRVKNSNDSIAQAIANRAYFYLSKKIPFDHKGNFDDDSQLYCTEMIWKILEKDLNCVTLPHETEARKKFFYSMTPLYSTDFFDIEVNQYNLSNK